MFRILYIVRVTCLICDSEVLQHSSVLILGPLRNKQKLRINHVTVSLEPKISTCPVTTYSRPDYHGSLGITIKGSGSDEVCVDGRRCT